MSDVTANLSLPDEPTAEEMAILRANTPTPAATVVALPSVFQHYAAVLLPFFILTIGATQTVLAHPRDLTVLVPYAILVAGAVGTFGAKLLTNAKWQGALKTGIAIVTTILSAVLPFLLPGGFDPKVSVPVIVVAVLNALATQLGVTIRVAAVAPVVDGVADISSLPKSTHGEHVA